MKRPFSATIFAALAAVLLITACSSAPERTIAGYERDPEPFVGDIALPAVNRGNVDYALRADPGEFLLVYFGFANCPDICPTTLSDARRAIDDLGDRSEDVGLALITIDPDRDNAEDLSNYVQAFVTDGVALRTEDQFVLQSAADVFGVTYAVLTDDAGEIEVNHTPSLFVVDDQGVLKLTWPFGVPSSDITNDLDILFGRLP